jgi:hypothetical protein
MTNDQAEEMLRLLRDILLKMEDMERSIVELPEVTSQAFVEALLELASG